MKLSASMVGRIPQRLVDLAASAEVEARRRAVGFRWDPTTGMTVPAAGAQSHDPRRLNVLMTKGGVSLFNSLQDERVRVFWPDEPVTEAPDLVVVTEPHRLIADPGAIGLADAGWERLRSGAAKLVIDSSGEGYPYSPTLFPRLRAALGSAGVEASDYVYITQDRNYRTDYLAARRSGSEYGAEVEVLVQDRYAQYLFSAIRGGGRKYFRQRLLKFAAAGSQRSRRFISLNNKFRPVRLLFLLSLLRDGLWDRGHISVGPLYEFTSHTLSKAQIHKRTLALEALRPISQALLPRIDELEALSPRYVGLGGATPARASDRMMIIPSMFEEYGDSWFSAVVETDFSNHLHRITEKPFKPLLCFHPLIVLGSCGSLRLIRDYGFRTFPEMFDETYDDETDPLARFEMVYEQVARLCAVEEAELARRSEAATATMIYNACWGLTQLPALFHDRIDAVLVDHLLARAHGPA